MYLCSFQISELAGHAVSLLDQHMKIKRSMPMGGSIQAKRMKRVPPTGHATHPKYVLRFSLFTSRKHLCTKVTPDFHLTYSKNGGNLGWESN